MARTLQRAVELTAAVSGTQKQCRGPQELSRLELDCIKAVWLDKATTVADVQRYLSPFRPLAYTTVMTVMDRLARKGALTRTKRGKAHQYEASLSLEFARNEAVAELVNRYFGGSITELINYLSSRSIVSSSVETTPEFESNDLSRELNDCLL